MKHWKSWLACMTMLAVVGVPPAQAQYHAGGRGLMYVHTARTLEKGNLNVYLHSRIYGKSVEAVSVSTTYWSAQGSFALNYGLSDRLELTLLPIIYQDSNSGPNNFPGDVFLKFKVGSLGSPSSRVKFGFSVSSRLPLGKTSNVVFEPYSSGNIEAGFDGLVSYASDVLFPDESFNLDFNLGYIYHNDAGMKMTNAAADTFSNAGTTSELTYGLGVRFPFDKWKVSAELVGNFFIREPAVNAYSRENYLYFTQGLAYRVADWLELHVAGDFRLSSDNDKTVYQFIGELPGTLPKSYPGWRVQTGLKVSLFPSATYRADERDMLVRKAETRREVFEQIVREQRETEKAEKELARIKEERIKAEKELERLRKLLDEDGTKKKGDKPKN